MTAHNYVMLKPSFGRAEVLYVDTPGDYKADQIFVKHQIPVTFSKKEMRKGKSKYGIVRVSFRKNFSEEFKKSMEELWNNMPLFGHSDYQQFCEDEFYRVLNDQKGV